MAQKIKLDKKNFYYERLKQKLFNFIHVYHFLKLKSRERKSLTIISTMKILWD